MDTARTKKQIADLIAANAIPMVEATIQEAVRGHYPAMKCLFEIAGLSAADPLHEDPQDDTLAKILLRQLGFPEKAVSENDAGCDITKDQSQGPVLPACRRM
jgi:hypothetical protein